MIRDKLRAMLDATKYSYQAARFSMYPLFDAEHAGLFNPINQTENFDTKLISVPFDAGYGVGDIFRWHNTDTLWIIFLQDHTELAYFRGHCRRIDHTVSWVDGNQNVQSAYLSVIGPSNPTLRKAVSTQAKVGQDFPNATLKIMVQDSPINRGFFHRYQTFLIDGIAYVIEQMDYLSMPGVIQFNATEHYVNLIEDDVENDLRNAWNVQPVRPSHPTEYMIEGPSVVKPHFEAEFKALTVGGHWVIVENENLSRRERPNPAKIVERDHTLNPIHIIWDDARSGSYTLGYVGPNGQLYQRHIVVESLM
jgi:hypothetical protein